MDAHVGGGIVFVHALYYTKSAFFIYSGWWYYAREWVRSRRGVHVGGGQQRGCGCCERGVQQG